MIIYQQENCMQNNEEKVKNNGLLTCPKTTKYI